MLTIPKTIKEYTIIGAGPASIAAIGNLLKSGVAAEDILWIDPHFRVGDFGWKLSQGSSVPGNTSVESYQKVNKEIYKLLSVSQPHFDIDEMQSHLTCLLNVAAQPLQFITAQFRQKIASIEASVTDIHTKSSFHEVIMKKTDGTLISILTRRTILATGAQPKKLSIPSKHSHIVVIDPVIAFIESVLSAYFQSHPDISQVAVVGSSHSAALATMHLLKAGLSVIQFMDKEYKYAKPSMTSDGVKYTLYDNTGLKGEVAQFTKALLNGELTQYQGKLVRHIGKNKTEVNALLEKHLTQCSHLVATIGYERSSTLQINRQPLSSYTYNCHTTEINDVKGLFGIGIAFPQEVKAISGEIELAVGVGKFWTTTSDPLILKTWKENAARPSKIEVKKNSPINEDELYLRCRL